VTDPFESYERTIAGQKQYIRDLTIEKQRTFESFLVGCAENRRLRDACRQTNKGITRLRRRCDSQTKKIAELKAIVREAMSRVDYAPPQHWIEAVEGRRPEKAT
jgi:hypothetical protein